MAWGWIEEAPDYFIRIFVCFVPGALSAPWSDPRPGHPVVTPGSHVLPDVTACDAPCHLSRCASDMLSRDDGPVM